MAEGESRPRLIVFTLFVVSEDARLFPLLRFNVSACLLLVIGHFLSIAVRTLVFVL